ncbi:MAG: hypothetical protein IPK26_20290 [Planctomycetes bacterium]|nr:hypothetical protein [Planctomycetota bacterium]
MNEKYWVRHRTLSGFAGPLTVEELGRAVRAASLPADCDVRQALAGVVAEALDGHGWTPAWQLLGIDPPPPPEPEVHLPDPGAPGLRMQHVVGDLRRHSAYPVARSLAFALAVLAAIVFVLLFGLQIAGIAIAGKFAATVAAIALTVLELAGLYVGYQVFVMFADIADCQLRQQTDRAVERTAQPHDKP